MIQPREHLDPSQRLPVGASSVLAWQLCASVKDAAGQDRTRKSKSKSKREYQSAGESSLPFGPFSPAPVNFR